MEPTCKRFAQMEVIFRKPITYLRQDHANENQKLAAQMKMLDWKRETVMEYTNKATPQQNSYLEL